MSEDQRTRTSHISDDGRRLIIVERWLDQQVFPPRWRSKNWHRKLTSNEITYLESRTSSTPPVDISC
jgi:hypothetical protein